MPMMLTTLPMDPPLSCPERTPFQLHGVCAGIPIEDRYFMVFNLFYDASSQETVEPDPLVVAGIVSTQEGWYEFERGWNRVLQPPFPGPG